MQIREILLNFRFAKNCSREMQIHHNLQFCNYFAKKPKRWWRSVFYTKIHCFYIVCEVFFHVCFKNFIFYIFHPRKEILAKSFTFHVRTHEFNQSNLRFLLKNTLLNNSHLERFTFFEACINLKKTFCTLFPMERHFFFTFFTDTKYKLLQKS